jgi:transposase InsO family protein
MTVKMTDAEQASMIQIREFLEGSREMSFEMESSVERHEFINGVLKRVGYKTLSRRERSWVRQYLGRLTGLGRAQLTRLILKWKQTGWIESGEQRRPRFVRHYTNADIALLAKVDEAHQTLSGPAVRRILQREYVVYDRVEYSRLSEISVSHLYNLRSSKLYRDQRIQVEPTQSVQRNFGERRKPEPEGRPGYLRVDTVHQGTRRDGGQKQGQGVYHLNAVDTVTQWEIVGCCSELTKVQMVPLLRSMLDQYPFAVLGFHSDNGSEYINEKVAELLMEMHVDFTKSRAYRTTDNALVEGKNGSVVRKHLGYGIFQNPSIRPINDFYREHFNPYLNYHRPCGFATVLTDERGRRRRSYPVDGYRTPYEQFKSLDGWTVYLKPGVTEASLDRVANRQSDTDAAKAMRAGKLKLFDEARR